MKKPIDSKNLINVRTTPTYRVIDKRNNQDVYSVGTVYKLQSVPGKKRRERVGTESISHTVYPRYRTMADVNALVTLIIRKGFKLELEHLEVKAYTHVVGFLERPNVKMDKKIETISQKVLLEKLRAK